jgi:hypothetical protein
MTRAGILETSYDNLSISLKIRVPKLQQYKLKILKQSSHNELLPKQWS